MENNFIEGGIYTVNGDELTHYVFIYDGYEKVFVLPIRIFNRYNAKKIQEYISSFIMINHIESQTIDWDKESFLNKCNGFLGCVSREAQYKIVDIMS